MWRSIYHDYEAEKGDILFIKKGANLTHQFFEDEFCAIFFFIPDDFIRNFLKKNSFLLDAKQKNLSSQDSVLRVKADALLNSYGQSIVSYLTASHPIDPKLVNLKFEELLMHLSTQELHQNLRDYFISLCQSKSYHMSRVMEENFAYRLKLDEYAGLCHMSLSSFKKAFKEYFNTTPAAWLRQRRLDLALHKLISSDLSIAEVAFESGFEDPSHFIRVFKKNYGQTPLQYRLDKINSKN